MKGKFSKILGLVVMAILIGLASYVLLGTNFATSLVIGGAGAFGYRYLKSKRESKSTNSNYKRRLLNHREGTYIEPSYEIY